MTKNIVIVLLLMGALGCKKNIKFSDDDTNLYKWKRDLYRASVEKEKPAVFVNRKGDWTASDHRAIFVSSDVVVLTEYRKDKQQDSIFKASGKMLVYKYEKLERAEE